MSDLVPPSDPKAQDEADLAPVHDFIHKLRQPPFHRRVVDYVAWQKAVRAAKVEGTTAPPMPDWAPLSINLDLTTACNYACDHCIDWEILNSGVSHDDRRLRLSVSTMAERGLRSVILIGGGEPTVYPGFREFVRFLKDLDLQVAIVSNGSRNERILDIVDCLDEHDWIRLSLDAGTDPIFQAMHKPKKAITLQSICDWIPKIKAANPRPRVGFSYVITWSGAEVGADAPTVVENLDEIPIAARLARDHGFDYISFKPFLTRTESGAEVMDPASAERSQASLVARLGSRMAEARAMAGASFSVVESINLRLLESGAWRDWTAQPRMCHMQMLRQVLSPMGLWNCPAHRGVPKARVDGPNAFGGEAGAEQAVAKTAEMLEMFNASSECAEVTCLYHDANWWIERAIESVDAGSGEGSLGPAVEDDEDYFL